MGTIVLVAWLAKHGKVSQILVAGFDDSTHGVAPISAEVNAATGQVILYHGPATSTPDLNSQRSVKLQAAPDNTLTDKAGQVVGRLEDKRLVPVPGVDIPGLFHGPAATKPYAEAPPGDEQPDQPGGQAAPDTALSPLSVQSGSAGGSLAGAQVSPGPLALPEATRPGLAAVASTDGAETTQVQFSVMPPRPQNNILADPITPPMPRLEGLPSLTEEEQRLLGQSEGFTVRPDAGTPDVEGFSIHPPMPNLLPGAAIQLSRPTLMTTAAPSSQTQQPLQAQMPTISTQKQDQHIAGTPEHQRRLGNGTPTSIFDVSPEDAYEIVQEAWKKGTAVPNRPGVKDYDLGRRIGTAPNGRGQTKVRVHQDSKGRIHGHPVGS